MDYHYKRPEEVRKDNQEKKIISEPYRNRSTRMVMADIFVICAIFFLIWRLGFFGDRATLTDLNIISTINESHLYLNVENMSRTDIVFPGESGAFRMIEAVLEVRQSDGYRTLERTTMNTITIHTGENHTFEMLPVSEEIRNTEYEDLRWKLIFQDRNVFVPVSEK